MADALREALEPVLGPVHVDGLRLLSGGASRETWSFDAIGHDEAAGDVVRHELVLQRTRGGVTGAGGPSMQVEDDLLVTAAQAGVPVPRLVVASRDAPGTLVHGGQGHARVLERIGGEALGTRIVRDERFEAARRNLAHQCGAALARIHSIDPDRIEGLALVEPLSRLRSGFDLLEVSRPAFELALRWLEDHRPEPRQPRVVHGDFRIGNLLIDETGLKAVLDWELAHLGDPVEDLGWLCVRSWRFGGEGIVGGVGTVEQLLKGYESGGGSAVDPEELRWWMLAGTLTWGLICAVQSRRHLDGHVRSVELAAIGRRICETEYDALQLLDLPGNHSSADNSSATAPSADGATDDAEGREVSGLHGRPTAAELVDAVGDHLRERVAPLLEGSAAFHLKVASNALGIVGRELRRGEGPGAELRMLLDSLGAADEADLAERIRNGELSGPEVVATARFGALERLRVANPRWLQEPDR